jgi:hypothetical protein
VGAVLPAAAAVWSMGFTPEAIRSGIDSFHAGDTARRARPARTPHYSTL